LYYSKEKDWLMTGNHEIVVWNMEKLTLEKMYLYTTLVFVLAEKMKAEFFSLNSLYSNRQVESSDGKKSNHRLSKIYSTRVILKKEKRIDEPL
jgi:hypothetical protein